jgi:hypothetical protein
MNVSERALSFKKRYPKTIAWRIKQHAKIVEKHLNPGEEIIYVFAGQKNDKFYDVWTTCVVALTNKRIIIAQKRVLFGYFFTSITPDLYNDLKVMTGIMWGKIYIDTVKELVAFSNIDKRSLSEIETSITEYMMKEKKEYKRNEEIA